MKSKKLDLKSLEIKSFVTSYSKEKSETLQGGSRLSVQIVCPFGPTTDTLDFDCPQGNTFGC